MTFQKSLIQTCLGFRPITFDGKPLIGALTEYPNVYVATGTKRDGLTYAPVIAENILDWINAIFSSSFINQSKTIFFSTLPSSNILIITSCLFKLV